MRTPPPPPYVVGIDLGTTNTLCAVWQLGEPCPRLLPLRQPVTGEDDTGYRTEEILPSAVAICPDRGQGPRRILVGRYARTLARHGHPNVVTSVKRRMGTRWVGPCGMSPERISACVLRAVRDEIARNFSTPPAQVVITIPASFGTDQRRATLRAATLAGFDHRVTRLFDEPAAALLHHILPGGSWPVAHISRLLVIDIGGGTLDVSVLQLRQENGRRTIDILGRSRYNELAGDDFDLNIAGLLLAKFEQEVGPVSNRADLSTRHHLYHQLLQAAENAKIRLSVAARTNHDPNLSHPIEITGLPQLPPWPTQLTRSELDLALQPFFLDYGARQGAENARGVEFAFNRAIWQCLESVRTITQRPFSGDNLDQVLLAGGSAELPMIFDAVRRILPGRQPQLVDQPMHAVALGAAWFAGVEQSAQAAQSGFLPESIEVRERLFEGVYLMLAGGQYTELLSPRELIPLPRRRTGRQLHFPEPGRCLEFSLFSGTGIEDLEMKPLARRRVDFGKICPRDHPVDLEVCVSQNRQIEVICTTEDPLIPGQRLQGILQMSTALGWQADTQPEPPLQEIINEPLGVAP